MIITGPFLFMSIECQHINVRLEGHPLQPMGDPGGRSIASGS